MWIEAPASNLANLDRVGMWDGEPYVPPVRHERSRFFSVPLSDHQKGPLDHIVVGRHLAREAAKRVMVRFDFKAADALLHEKGVGTGWHGPADIDFWNEYMRLKGHLGRDDGREARSYIRITHF